MKKKEYYLIFSVFSFYFFLMKLMYGKEFGNEFLEKKLKDIFRGGRI